MGDTVTLIASATSRILSARQQACAHCVIQGPNITLWYGVPSLLYFLYQYCKGQCWLWMMLELFSCAIGHRSGDLKSEDNMPSLCRVRCVTALVWGRTKSHR
ncbi:hypothetical protein TNCV_1875801 [Trichonephila clavipes]|nr:hypothetical protein TNCV_1875801 [Trichonephila clavipes]